MKPILFTLGIISCILGIIGAILPVVPTTPFMILAAYFFSKSSPKMHQKILDLPGVGPMVREWEEKKIIRPKAKFMCVFIIAIVIASSIYRIGYRPYLIAFLLVVAISVSAFVLTRKSS